MKKKIIIPIINVSNCQLTIIIDNGFTFTVGTPNEVIRFLKGVYNNKQSFKINFLNKIKNITIFNTSKFCNNLSLLYDTAVPYSFKEAFEISNNEYRAMVFGSINIHDMIENLGAKRIACDGKETIQKRYNKGGDFIENIKIINVYEVYEVSKEKLNLNENVYVLKCWCTTTNNEHWLWIDEKHKNNPLEAIASTFLVHENIIPYIKELKRQGDILFVEMKNGSENIIPKGNLVPLSAEQYFGLLTAQS